MLTATCRREHVFTRQGQPRKLGQPHRVASTTTEFLLHWPTAVAHPWQQGNYFIDLLFFHRFPKSLVAIDLKVGEFQPAYAVKIVFYLNLLNDKERGLEDSPSIGIIPCAEKDDLEVEFALKCNVILFFPRRYPHSCPNIS